MPSDHNTSFVIDNGSNLMLLTLKRRLDRLQLRTTKGIIGIVCTTVLFISSTSLSAQIQRAPADTGISKWGYEDLTEYNYPSMCDRAGLEFIRYYSRFYEPDTTLEDILDSLGKARDLPEEGREVLQECLARYSPQHVPEGQLWGYVRASLLLNNDEQALTGIERLIAEAPDSTLREQAYIKAIITFMANYPRRLDLIFPYLERLDALSETPSPGSIAARNLLMQYWRNRYYPDSVRKYAYDAVRLIKEMSFQVKEKTNIVYAFDMLITTANNEGNIAEQEAWLDSMAREAGDWGSGQGGQLVAAQQRLIDFRKSLYGRRSNPITEGEWFNTQGKSWPVQGKASILVQVDHLCTLKCVDQYRTIKRLKTVFGDNLYIVLVTPSSGHSIGTEVLNLEAEGDSIVSLFTNVYEMPYAVLLDPRPTSKIADGRIVRGIGPVADLFSEWRGMNAVFADSEGRIQWMGSVRRENDLRSTITTIRRFVSPTP